MFNRASDFTFDIYDGATDQYLGRARYNSAFELNKLFLDIVNYGRADAMVLRNAELYLPVVGYIRPNPYQKHKRRMVARALFTDANSGEQVPIEVRLKYDLLFRVERYRNIFRSIELTDIVIEDIKYLHNDSNTVSGIPG